MIQSWTVTFLWQVYSYKHLDVSKNSDTPKWMVKIRENPYEQMDENEGENTTPIFGSTSI